MTAIGNLHNSILHGRSDRLELTAEEATEERLKTELSKYEIVHIATHGFFQPQWSESLGSAGNRLFNRGGEAMDWAGHATSSGRG